MRLQGGIHVSLEPVRCPLPTSFNITDHAVPERENHPRSDGTPATRLGESARCDGRGPRNACSQALGPSHTGNTRNLPLSEVGVRSAQDAGAVPTSVM